MFIFLDIDGVLNKESDWSKPFSLSSDCIRRFCEKYREARIILIKEHPSIREYVVVDDDIKEYSSKDIPHLRLVDSKVGFR